MLTAVLVLQVLVLFSIVVLSIQLYAGRKLTEEQQQVTEQLTETSQKLTEQLTEQLTETSQKLTEQLTEEQQQVTEQLTETSQKLTERLTEDQRKLTEQLTETSEKLTQVLSIQLYDRGKLTEDQQKLTEVSQKLTEQLTEKRVSVLYDHIIHSESGLFRSKVVAGYRVQFLYDGLPIGEPTEKIVYSADKVDEEAVREALTAALQTLQVTIEKSGISLTVLNKVADVIKTLFKK